MADASSKGLKLSTQTTPDQLIQTHEYRVNGGNVLPEPGLL